ncbi:pantoate--beta-alanine ligase [Lentisphaera profundi]|uniref:Pantothenate synthetase n=1 Tax=Lentisphaera profundi TaxID=1658616 RepID=A0ABY7VU94_9BACT|nr:pantoate--beta-alanine ligase [Lentisphaera profundi]WDE96848.1 pantoate--beta-alanine ligase [Lentisphaera profundi]
MQQIKTIAQMQELSKQWHFSGDKVAVVPTMGALHEGHLSLIRVAKKHAQKVIVTIFVNPTQFGEGEDLDAYPQPLKEDMRLCDLEGASAVFTPSAAEMYPKDSSTWVDEAQVGLGLCGAKRPGHFRGVTTIVTKLFLAVLPDYAIFGEKDFQQLAVIRRMVRDLNFPVTIIGAPLIREKDGLAMSSRNRYLNTEQRQGALSLSSSLKYACEKIDEDNQVLLKKLKAQMKEIIEGGQGKLDYIEILHAESLEELAILPDSGEIRILVAASFGPARLIDNVGITLG